MPFLGEIAIFAGNFAPAGWFTCEGQLLAIEQYTALFSLLGTTYGGDGRSNFALPDLQGRHAVGFGQGPGLSIYDLGENGGEETVTLLESQLPAHGHTPQSASTASSTDPTGRYWAPASSGTPYGELSGGPTKTASACAMSPQALQPSGGGQPHENRPPSLALTFIIAYEGIFPSRS